MPVFLGLVLIAVFWIAYEKMRTAKIVKKNSDEFWKRETEADMVRKKDISALAYIEIPYDSLPFTESQNDEIKAVQKQLKKLKDKKMVNLTGLSNTDLKFMYGAPNLHLLSEYDHNFTLLTRYLYKWGVLLFESGDKEAAKTVLIFGLACGTDISSNYTLLANIYAKENEPAMIEQLIDSAQSIKTVMKEAAIRDLRNILVSYYSSIR